MSLWPQQKSPTLFSIGLWCLTRLQLRLNELRELLRVGVEGAEAFGGLLGGHRVFVEQPAEGFFVQRQFRDAGSLGGVHAQLARERRFGLLQFREQVRADGEQVATGQLGDLAEVAEARAHDFGAVAKFFVVAVDLLHGDHAGIFGGREIAFLLGLIPIHDAADERRDEFDVRFGAGDGLREREEQREIAVDAVAL